MYQHYTRRMSRTQKAAHRLLVIRHVALSPTLTSTTATPLPSSAMNLPPRPHPTQLLPTRPSSVINQRNPRRQILRCERTVRALPPNLRRQLLLLKQILYKLLRRRLRGDVSEDEDVCRGFAGAELVA